MNRTMRSLALSFSLLLLACGTLSLKGKTFGSLEEMDGELKEWELQGRFGPQAGPFTVVQVQECAVGEECVFSIDSQPQSYPPDATHSYRIVTLRSSAPALTWAVLKSK